MGRQIRAKNERSSELILKMDKLTAGESCKSSKYEA